MRLNRKQRRAMKKNNDRRLFWRPRLERLEDKLAPAVFAVNTLLDTVDANPGDGLAVDANGSTSLRAAVMEANAHAGPDQIILPAGNYNLAIAGADEDLAATGDLDITDSLTITGPGAASTSIDASTIPGGDRVFDCIGSIDVHLTGLTVTGGNVVADGGGILNRVGTLSVSACTITGNTSITPPIEYYIAGGGGGGICNGDRNMYTPVGTLVVDSSIVSGNHASEGGGILNCASATVTGSQISGNSAVNSAGGIFNLSLPTAQLTLVNSTVSGNSCGGFGGGIYNAYYAHATVTNCTINGNLAHFGAGIADDGSELSLSNSTLTSNGSNGTPANGGVFGGGMYINFHAVVSLDHVTLSDNNGNFGSGICNIGWEYGGSLTVSNSIIAYNTGQTINPGWNRNYFSGNASFPTGLTSLGHNIDMDGSCALGAPGDLSLVDPLLGPLADNGGPTQTRALLAGSPAIDAGDPLDATVTDQRGFNRPADGDGDGFAFVDIGAYEFTASNSIPVVSISGPAHGPPGEVLHYTGSFTDPDPDTWTGTVNFGDGSGDQSLALNPDKSFAFDHAYANPGFYDMVVTVADNHGGVGTGTASIIANTAPVMTRLDGPTTGLYGESLHFSGAFFDPDAGDSWHATVDFGDGSAVQTLTPNPDQTFAFDHAFASPGTYSVFVAVTDAQLGRTARSQTVTIHLNTPPVVSISGPAVGRPGDTLHYSGGFIDPDPDTWTGTVNFGDGTGDQPLALNPDKSFAFDHAFANAGVYHIVVTVVDSHGGVGSHTAIVVANTAPVITALDWPEIGLPGEPLHFTGAFFDPDADSWTGTVNFGDGTGDQPLALNSDRTFAFDHAFTNLGIYDGTVSVTDSSGQFAAVPLTVFIQLNTAPAVTSFAGPTSAVSAQTLHYAGSFFDPDADTWTGTVNFGDGTGDQPLDLNPYFKTFTVDHAFASYGSYTVVVTVVDNHGGVGTRALSVFITDNSPVITSLTGPTFGAAGDLLHFTGSFSDPDADTWTGTVVFGDGGNDVQLLVLNPDKTFAFDHAFPAPSIAGSYRMFVRVNDDRGGTGISSLDVTIADTAPVITSLTAPTDGAAGQPLHFTCSFTDPDLHDGWLGQVDFGEHSTPLVLYVQPGTFEFDHVFFRADTFHVTVFVTDGYGVGTDELDVTVAPNEIPAITALDGPTTGGRDQSLHFTGSFTDSDPDTWTGTVDFGDFMGSQPLVLNPDQTFAFDHAFTKAGTYSVTVRVVDNHDVASSFSLKVTIVANNPPVITALDGPTTGLHHQTLHFTGSFTDINADTWTGSAGFSDDSDGIYLVLNPDKTFSFDHAFLYSGTYNVGILITDNHGGYDSRSLTVTIPPNDPPVVTSLDGPTTGYRGQVLHYTGSFTDADPDIWTRTVDFGDGSGGEIVLNPGKTFSFDHTYNISGTFTLTVIIGDDQFAIGSRSLTVTVAANTSPVVASLDGPTTGYRGQVLHYTGAFTDPDFDTWTGTVNVDDGTNIAPLVVNSDKTFAFDHAFAYSGTFLVNVNVSDDRGGIDAHALVVVIVNTPPVVTYLIGPTTAVRGQGLHYTGAFTDSGADIWTGTVNFGDGSGDQPVVLNPDKTFTIDHVFAGIGNYNLTVTVADSERDVGTRTLPVNVGVTALEPDPIHLGQTILAVGGTPAADSFSFSPGARAGSVAVSLNNVVLGAFTPTGGRVVAYGSDGADSMTINGSNAADSFVITATGLALNGATFDGDSVETTNLNGQGGSDTLAGANTANSWAITGTNAGALSSVTFTSMENLTGGTGGDTFNFSPGAGLSGTIDGSGGTDTMNGAAGTNTWTLTGANAGNVNGIRYTNIEQVNGGSGTDTLKGANVANTWNISSSNGGTVSTLTFTGIENLTGGTAADTFNLSAGAGLTGTISGGAGTDTISGPAGTTTWALTGANAGTVNGMLFTNIAMINGGSGTDTLIGADGSHTWTITRTNAGTFGALTFTGMENLTGGAGADTFDLSSGAGLTGTLDGGAGADTLVGDNVANTWDVTGTNAGRLGTLAFVGIENLTGGTGDDTFGLTGGSGLTGAISGGSGTDTINGPGTTNIWALTGANAGAANGTSFTGIEKVNGGTGADTLVGRNATNNWNITGTNAGTLGALAFTGMENLTGGAGNDTFQFANGKTVTGVLNGGAGTNTLDYALYVAGVTVNLLTGSATGTSGVTNIQNLTGGAGNDNLTGNAADNAITGNDGSDTIAGDAGTDVLDGGSGNDTLLGGIGFLDVLTGGDGNDMLIDVDGVSGASGGNGNDTIDLTFALGWTLNGSPVLPAGAISGGAGNDIIRVTSNTAALQLEVDGDAGTDQIELYGTWNRVKVVGGSGTDTLKNRCTGVDDLNGIEIQL